MIAHVVARESGQGYWMEDVVAGTLRAEGEDRPSRPSHVIGHVVAPPLTATNDPSRSPQSAEVTAQVHAVLRAQYPEIIGSLDTECGGVKLTHQSAKNGHLLPVVPYDLFQITAPINRQSRDERSPCHTRAKDNAAHADVVQPVAFTFDDGQSENPKATHQFSLEHSSPLIKARPLCAASTTMSVRRLTPTECERLQGFPDGWTAIPWKGKPASECPDGPRYKALGNSMAVNCMRWIGARIQAVEEA
jgi:DNA (cytosine-5)-methyltransferase 1